MKIASIDYGLNCGVAIASLEIDSKDICVLNKIYLNTVYDNIPEIREILYEENPESVVLEKCPNFSENYSLFIFRDTHLMLRSLGYSDSNDPIKERSLAVIGPGQWKPFVKKQNLDLKFWDPKTQHEKDAMSLLWYALKIKLKKEIKYA